MARKEEMVSDNMRAGCRYNHHGFRVDTCAKAKRKKPTLTKSNRVLPRRIDRFDDCLGPYGCTTSTQQRSPLVPHVTRWLDRYDSESGFICTLVLTKPATKRVRRIVTSRHEYCMTQSDLSDDGDLRYTHLVHKRSARIGQ